jgi:hypothetical protein
MDQHIPKVTRTDIDRLIRRDFVEHDPNEILHILMKFESDEGIYRVWAAALKLSEGNPKMLEKEIGKANQDYRDVLSYAEFPEYFRKVGFKSDKISKSDLSQIIESDWKQYQDWFNAKSIKKA